jgi:hypothetical protein
MWIAAVIRPIRSGAGRRTINSNPVCYKEGESSMRGTGTKGTKLFGIFHFWVVIVLGITAAHAQDFPLRATLQGELTRTAIEQILIPLTFDTTTTPALPASITLREMIFCGATDSSHASAIAIGYPSAFSAQPSSILAPSACSDPLNSTANKALAQSPRPDSVVVARLVISSQAWQVDIRVTEALVENSTSSPGLPPTISDLLKNNGQPIVQFKTSDLSVTLDQGSKLDLDVLVQFNGDTIVFGATPHGALILGADPKISTTNIDGPMMGDAKLALAARVTLLDNLLQTEFGTRTFVLAVAGRTVELTHVRVTSAADAQLTTSGTVASSGVTFDVSVAWKGPDLAVDSVSIAQAHVNCSLRDFVVCNAKKVAAQALEVSIGALVKGRLLRPLDDANLHVGVFGKQLKLSLKISKAAALGGDLTLYGMLQLARD